MKKHKMSSEQVSDKEDEHNYDDIIIVIIIVNCNFQDIPDNSFDTGLGATATSAPPIGPHPQKKGKRKYGRFCYSIVWLLSWVCLCFFSRKTPAVAEHQQASQQGQHYNYIHVYTCNYIPLKTFRTL